MNTCEWCKGEFIQKKGCIKFCSIKCKNSELSQRAVKSRRKNPGYTSWNKGLTKETDKRVRKNSENTTKTRKRFGYFHKKNGIDFGYKEGNIPHNKGRTKENYESSKKQGETYSKNHKGITFDMRYTKEESIKRKKQNSHPGGSKNF